MKWITRCPDCGTVYTLDLGQLKMANGWLRCGHCQHIFDSSGLVVSTDLVPTLTEAVSPSRLQSAPLHLREWLHLEDQPGEVSPPPPMPSPEPLVARSEEEPTPMPPKAPIEAPAASRPAHAPDEPPRVNAAAAGAPMPSDLPAATHAPVAVAPLSSSPDPVLPSTALATDTVPPHPVEDFAQALKSFPGPRSARPSTPSPLHRWLMGACIALSLSLLWQGLLAVRRPLLLHWPALTPVVRALCLPLSCEPVTAGVDLWQLAPVHWTPAGLQGVRLDWTLSHRAPTTQTTPAVAMTVVDARGQILSQRILSPEQWGAPMQLAPGLRQEGHLQLQGPETRHISAIRLQAVDR